MKATASMDQNKEYNNIIDLMKLFFAIGVLGIHTGIAKVFSESINFAITKVWFRMAVPFFFIATGFFYGKKLYACGSKQKRGEVLLDFCQKNGFVLIVFGSITLGQVIYGSGISSEVVKTIHDAVFYPQGAMWYVAATIVGAIIIFILYDQKFIMVALAIPLFSFALLCNNYYFVFSNTRIENIINAYMEYFVSARNGIFVGFPYMLCGVMLFEFTKKNKKFDNLWKLCPIIVFVLYLVEIMFCKNKESIDDCSIYIMSPFLAMTIFYLSLTIKIPLSKKHSLVMRSYSKIIYFFHSVFLNGIIGRHIIRRIDSSIFSFIYTLAMCIITIVIIKRIKPVRKTVGKFFF